MSHMEKDIAAAEKELDDDAESIITNDRYEYITTVLCCWIRPYMIKSTMSLSSMRRSFYLLCMREICILP